jgi:nicotinamidase-related amidase
MTASLGTAHSPNGEPPGGNRPLSDANHSLRFCRKQSYVQTMAKQALLIVDLQAGLFSTPRFDAVNLIRRLNEMADRFRKRGAPVILVQQCGPEGDPLHPSQPGHALHEDLVVEQSDVRIAKESCDAFLNTRLANYLLSNGVDEVVVTGFATEFCVDTTIRSALAHGFKTVVPKDGHSTADRAHLSAAKIIEHHNETWRWLLSPAGPARIVRCADVG